MDDARIRAVLATSYRASALVAAIAVFFAYLDPQIPAALLLGLLTGLVFVMMTAAAVRRMGADRTQPENAGRRLLKFAYALKLLIAAAAVYVAWRFLPDKLAFFAAGYTVPLVALVIASLQDACRGARQAGKGQCAETQDRQ